MMPQAPSLKNWCIALVVVTCCWCIVYVTLSPPVIVTLNGVQQFAPPRKLPDGMLAIVGALLSINAIHSGWQAHVAGRTEAALGKPKDAE